MAGTSRGGEHPVEPRGRRGRHVQVRRRPAGALRGAGIDRDTGVITYCRIGERSSHTWFALHELLDHPEVKNYDGSWTEYGSLVGVPVQTGDERGSAVAPSRA